MHLVTEAREENRVASAIPLAGSPSDAAGASRCTDGRWRAVRSSAQPWTHAL